MEVLWKYYGVDALGTILTLISLWLLGNQSRNGFLVGMFSNVAWGAFGVLSDSVATVVANVLVLALSLRGYFRWAAAAPIPPTAR